MGATTAKVDVDDRLLVEQLNVTYRTPSGFEHAVKDVSLEIKAGEILGIVGESGSGKSSIAQAVLRLEPDAARVTGRILLGNDDLVPMSQAELTKVRGRRIGMVFQDPAAALNPVFRISTQIVDTLRRHHRGLSKHDATQRAGAAIEAMGIPAARLSSFPHQLSGGMRQRALIAAAMSAEPAFLVADEPTSDLDTVSQTQILDLLLALRAERNIGILLISHDMRVIAATCDKIGVMTRGVLVELGSTHDVLTNPKAPYTQALLQISRRERHGSGRFVTMADVVGDDPAPADGVAS
jgi:ABC-type dipeptide/oligopeptide/nickel transport system ATPase component